MQITRPENLVQIGLIEFNPFNRETLLYTLKSQPDFQIAFAVASVNEVPRHDRPIDVMLFSAGYPSEVFGNELSLHYWRIRMPGARLVLLTANKSRAVIQTLVDQGLEGYAIRQTLQVQTLFNIIRVAKAGMSTFCPAAQEILAHPGLHHDLSCREIQVIRLIHEMGSRNRKQIAQVLGVSPITVNEHLKNISAKLNASGVAEVLEHGRMLGIVEPAPTGPNRI